jgi:predicted oxidoreductase
MRLLQWNFSDKELLSFIKECIELGVTSFDHADIYGDYECEEKFGDALKLDSSLRNNIEIITKCGIKDHDTVRHGETPCYIHPIANYNSIAP